MLTTVMNFIHYVFIYILIISSYHFTSSVNTICLQSFNIVDLFLIYCITV